MDFSGRNMNLNGLQIRKFAADELEEILNNEINRIFYPEAYFDNNFLLHCWFLKVDDIEPASNIIYEYSKYPFKRQYMK